MARQVTTTAEAVKELREQAEMSIYELAEASGVNFRTIYRIENGEHTHPRISTIRAIAKVFGLHSRDLLVDEEQTA
jgi:transcriptional regulator with XRE-family HTH domain